MKAKPVGNFKAIVATVGNFSGFSAAGVTHATILLDAAQNSLCQQPGHLGATLLGRELVGRKMCSHRCLGAGEGNPSPVIYAVVALAARLNRAAAVLAVEFGSDARRAGLRRLCLGKGKNENQAGPSLLTNRQISNSP
ncbi:MAG: hypothetical protein WD294_03990 [Phycisphaeraceae bacterium]